MNAKPLVRVLLVEDSRSDALLLQNHLSEIKDQNFSVTWVERVDDAVARLRAGSFDVGLLDLSLPDSTGIATFTRIQETAPQLPIVVLTGAEDESLGLEAIRRGVRDYLVKGQADGKTVARAIRYAIERQRAEDALLQLNEQLEQRVQERTLEVQRLADQLRALAVELTRAEQRERKRLAAILHDHLQQLLVAARMQLSLIAPADAQGSRQTMQNLEAILAEALSTSRSLATELSPPILLQSGFAAALAWLAKRLEAQHLFKIDLQVDRDAEPDNEEIATFLFESVRELLLNAIKHSGVQTAQVMMERTQDRQLRITISDKGKGFEADPLKRRHNEGFGLFSIQQRLIYLGGTLKTESRPGEGVKAILQVPLAESLPKKKEPAAPADTTPVAEVIHARDKIPKIRVLIVDDHRIMRQGLVTLLKAESDIEVVGEAENGRLAIEQAERLKPDVVVMDVNMPVMGGIEAARTLLKALPRVKVIGLSMHIDHEIAATMIAAGACDYVTKGEPSENLITAIRRCVANVSAGMI